LIAPLIELAPAFKAAAEAAKQFGDVSVKAADRSTEAQKRAVAQHGIGLVAAIGNRRAAAVIETIWETAKGFAALGDFNYWGAAQHFLSAAEYGVLAGTGGGKSAGASASMNQGRQIGAGATSAPQTLAPGAAGAGGRFGNLHVIVVGEAQAGQWLANTLNRAVDRGVTLNSTTAQRGSPVGH
jgi:hypothetical protein